MWNWKNWNFLICNGPKWEPLHIQHDRLSCIHYRMEEMSVHSGVVGLHNDKNAKVRHSWIYVEIYWKCHLGISKGVGVWPQLPLLPTLDVHQCSGINGLAPCPCGYCSVITGHSTPGPLWCPRQELFPRGTSQSAQRGLPEFEMRLCLSRTWLSAAPTCRPVGWAVAEHD